MLHSFCLPTLTALPIKPRFFFRIDTLAVINFENNNCSLITTSVQNILMNNVLLAGTSMNLGDWIQTPSAHEAQLFWSLGHKRG